MPAKTYYADFKAAGVPEKEAQALAKAMADSDARFVTAQEVAQMLRRVKAPEPWRNPDGCLKIAGCIKSPLHALHFTDTSRFDECQNTLSRNRMRRAQDAINELRRLLPTVISRFKNDADLVRGFRDGHQLKLGTDLDRVEDFEKLLALLESLPRLTLRHPTPWWQLDAARLFTLYRTTVSASAGMSEEGPAIRFIHEALKKMGYSAQITKSGIAHALRRRSQDWHEISMTRLFLDI
jgi:hypothetical protein